MKRQAMLPLLLVTGLACAAPPPDCYTGRDIMQAAKITGACGVFLQLQHFQTTTQLPGGDEVVRRFIHTEATRMGWTVNELNANCQMAVRNHMKFETLLKEVKLQSP